MPTISLALGERSYDIHVENGALDRVGEFAYRAGLDGKIAIITDTCVAPALCGTRDEVPGERWFMPSLPCGGCRRSVQEYAAGPGTVFRAGTGGH